MVANPGKLLLPPTTRDFEVYRLVMVDQCPTRVAAKQAGVSQTRVCQIVKRVGDFFKKTTPTAPEVAEEIRRGLWVAQNLASSRVDSMHRILMRAYHASVDLTRGKRGDTKFMALALRVANAGAKLPTSNINYAGYEAEDEDEAEAKHVAEAREEMREVYGSPGEEAETFAAEDDTVEAVDPPVEGCSSEVPKTEVAAETAVVNSVVSPAIDLVSEVMQALANTPNSHAKRPVQNEDEPRKRTSGKKLSRAQRRARMKFLKAEDERETG